MGAGTRRRGRLVGSVRALFAAALIAAAALVLPAAPAVAAEAESLYSLLNQARWDAGLVGLLRNPAMDQVAANWAAQLSQNGVLSHNPNYSTQIPGGWSRAGENVAQGYGSASSMHAGWMGSSGHRANILGSYTDVGIAFLNDGVTTWGVQVFAAYSGHVGPSNPAPPPPPPPPPPPADPPPAPDPAPPPAAESGSGSGSGSAPQNDQNSAESDPAVPSLQPAPSETPDAAPRADHSEPPDRPDAAAAASVRSPAVVGLLGLAVLAAAVAALVVALLRRGRST